MQPLVIDDLPTEHDDFSLLNGLPSVVRIIEEKDDDIVVDL